VLLQPSASGAQCVRRLHNDACRAMNTTAAAVIYKYVQSLSSHAICLRAGSD
jgi:hypothetical protein